jgi:hypothetical protein
MPRCGEVKSRSRGLAGLFIAASNRLRKYLPNERANVIVSYPLREADWARFDGSPEAETRAILTPVTEKYQDGSGSHFTCLVQLLIGVRLREMI